MPALKRCVIEGCEQLTFSELCADHRDEAPAPGSSRVLPAPTPPPPVRVSAALPGGAQ